MCAPCPVSGRQERLTPVASLAACSEEPGGGCETGPQDLGRGGGAGRRAVGGGAAGSLGAGVLHAVPAARGCLSTSFRRDLSHVCPVSAHMAMHLGSPLLG